MAAGWCSKAMSVVVAVGATVALASYVEASPAGGSSSSVRVVSAPRATPPAARPTALPPVTEHPISVPDLDQPSSGGSQSVTQVVTLSIVGGPLELATEQATVVLERVSGSKADWVGTLPPVRVVDARGTHEGWEVRWAVGGVGVESFKRSHVPAAKVQLEPSDPVVVAGLPDGLAAGKPGPAVPKGRVLFSAAPGSGGGTYEAGGTVTLRLPSSVDASAVTVHLTFTLG
jgi:hypothetical protein